MNKRASVPIVIFVIGVLVVCTMALVSFNVSSSYTKNSFFFLNAFTKVEISAEQFAFYKNVAGLSSEESAAKIKAKIVDGNLVIQSNEFSYPDLVLEYTVPIN